MRKSGYRKCSVKRCKNTTANSNCRFFRFPKDNARAKQWVTACNREDLVLKTAEYLYAINRICSDHFEDRMYANDLKSRLLPSARPTLNLHNHEENDQNIAIASNTSQSAVVKTSHVIKPTFQIEANGHDYIGTALASELPQIDARGSQVNKLIEANGHDYIETASASEFLPQTDTPVLVSKLNCTDVQRNVSSITENATSGHNFGIKHNEMTLQTVILRPIHSVSTNLQSSIIVSSANHSIAVNPKLTVAAPFYVVHPSSPGKVLRNTQCYKDQLPVKQSLNKMVQTTKELCAHESKKLKFQKLKLQKEIRILRKENAALRETIEKMNLSKNQFLKCCEKYVSPQVALFIKEQISVHNQKAKGRRYSLKFKRLCLNLHFKRPRTYKALSSIFSLPSRATLQRMTTKSLVEV
ncbi:uncharacterized protein LOC105276581 isoform X2 [Ooceraea biroi]|uniref:uncharacterized protein LOC105276581 isoform X2 n=1 Tax=Ooceraea biroi TaxID=2015173 RepID=UPI0005BE26FB|nr:uncharacterized protein LOC105276581 isoform X2 [Ooceraea biroi]